VPVTAATGAGLDAQESDADDVSDSTNSHRGARGANADPGAAHALPETGFRGQSELGLGLVLLGGGLILVGGTRVGLRTTRARHLW
jgi:hypothetical protein